MDTSHFIKGLHHVTATVNDAQEDFDFYTKLLGLRLVKKTVNFDNNQVYHFYYADKVGTPGTVMTTFPYKGQKVRDGVPGTGQVSITAFSIATSALDFWETRLNQAGVSVQKLQKFGNSTLQFKDPSGLILEIVGNEEDQRNPDWTTSEISIAEAIKGFFTVTLSLAELAPSHEFLVNTFGFKKIAEEGNLSRYAIAEGAPGQFVDISHDAEIAKGLNGIGTVHHVAWRIENDENLLAMRKHLTEELGFKVTEVKDRNYFHSIYFRMPGHVLFEIATIPPGFSIDESVAHLGEDLKLPAWEEVNRAQIESVLPPITD